MLSKGFETRGFHDLLKEEPNHILWSWWTVTDHLHRFPPDRSMYLHFLVRMMLSWSTQSYTVYVVLCHCGHPIKLFDPSLNTAAGMSTAYRVMFSCIQIKLSLSTPWRHRDSGGIAPLILNLGASWRWVINITPRPLYPVNAFSWGGVLYMPGVFHVFCTAQCNIIV